MAIAVVEEATWVELVETREEDPRAAGTLEEEETRATVTEIQVEGAWVEVALEDKLEESWGALGQAVRRPEGGIRSAASSRRSQLQEL